MMISIGAYVCASMLFTHRSRYGAVLYTGTITEINLSII